MKFRPLHDRIVVKRIEAEAKSAGGIIIPDTVKEKPSQGEVVAVGPGGRDESGKLVPIDLKANERSRGPLTLFLFQCFATDEIFFLEIDELSQSDLRG